MSPCPPLLSWRKEALIRVWGKINCYFLIRINLCIAICFHYSTCITWKIIPSFSIYLPTLLFHRGCSLEAFGGFCVDYETTLLLDLTFRHDFLTQHCWQSLVLRWVQTFSQWADPCWPSKLRPAGVADSCKTPDPHFTLPAWCSLSAASAQQLADHHRRVSYSLMQSPCTPSFP